MSVNDRDSTQVSQSLTVLFDLIEVSVTIAKIANNYHKKSIIC